MDRTLKVTGKGRLSLRPDTVRFIMNCVSKDPDYEKTVSQSAEAAREIKDGFRALGFSDHEVKTLSYSVNTEYESIQENGNWKQRFAGYRAELTLKLEYPAEKNILGGVMKMLSGLNSSPEFRVEYTVKDTEAAKNRLLANAVLDAREKANVLADAAGVTLGEVLTVDYSWGEVSFEVRPMAKLAMARNAAADFEIEPEDINVEDTVTVVWKIDD